MKYAGVIPNDTVDVDKGLAVSFWVQGCPHHCPGCHNPETWDKDGGYELPPDYIPRIEKLLKKNGIRRNLSILGGEPLCNDNVSIVFALLLSVKHDMPWTKTFVWTGGKFEALKLVYPSTMKLIDVLIDGPFDITHRDITLPLRGSPNQRVIDVQESLKLGQTIIIPDEKLRS